MRLLSKFLLFSGVALLLASGGITVIKAKASASEETDSANTQTTATVDTMKPAFDSATLTAKLDTITAAYSSIDVSIAVTDLANGQNYTYGDMSAYIGASTTKTLVAALYLHQVEEGVRTLDEYVGDDTAASQITAMIEQSDNEAWIALRSSLTFNALQNYADDIGMTNFNAIDNTVTTSDMTLLLQKLYAGILLNTSSTALLLNHMQNSVRDYISPALPSNYTVYHKAGWLDDRLLETAIITDGSRSYVLTIFTKTLGGTYDFEAGAAYIKNVVTLINDTLMV